MFARFIAPALTIIGMLACTTDLPLEAQRATHKPLSEVVGPLTFPAQTGVLNPGGTFTGGTITITSLSRQGSDILASGSVAITEAATGEFTDVSVNLASRSWQRCESVYFFFDPFTVNGVEVRSLWGFAPSNNTLGSELCDLGRALEAKHLKLDLIDQTIASINAQLGG